MTTHSYKESRINKGDRLICVRTRFPDELRDQLWYFLIGVSDPINHGTLIEVIGVTSSDVVYRIIPRTKREKEYEFCQYSDPHLAFITFFTDARAVLTDRQLFLYELSWKLPRYVRKQCRDYDEKTIKQFIQIIKEKNEEKKRLKDVASAAV